MAAIMLMFATVLTVGCKKENKCNCNLNEGDWVDLGLPSGLLWATRNVGASSPTDYGDYFAWAEITPKSKYDWRSYRYCVYDEYRDSPLFTKYYTPYYGYYNNGSDGLIILQPIDDVSTANYGGRTPTKDECQELYNNTKSRWVTIDGVDGLCFTGSNGNSLFLPAASWFSDSKGKPGYGFYWSSSLDTMLSRRSWCYDFYHEYDTMWIRPRPRNYGCSVRAVRDAH